MKEIRAFFLKIKKKHIIYAIFLSLLITLLILYLVSRFVPNNFIRVFYENNWEPKIGKSFIDFLKDYIDAFFIYSISTILILWVSNIVLGIFGKRISPDIKNTIKLLVRVIIIPLFIIAYLSKFEAFSGAIIGVGATLGAVFALASAKYISDLVTSFYVIFSKNHNVGDYILIPSLNVEGIITEISISFTTIKQAGEITAIIPTSQLKDKDIINIKLTKIEKEIDEVSDLILYGRKVKETLFIYPLKWSVNSEDSHKKCVEAIEKTSEQFKEELEYPIEWRIITRNRLDRTYQLNLTVIDPEILLTLIGDFYSVLEQNYEKIKQKK
ncbi:MAG: mechanosensitive ion channel domain-containing protein [Candidatus Heimdallarchaeaceae archaeon]